MVLRETAEDEGDERKADVYAHAAASKLSLTFVKIPQKNTQQINKKAEQQKVIDIFFYKI